MAKQSKDFLTQVREQAERTLAILTSEIRKREAELNELLEQARMWRDALTEPFTPAAKKRPVAKKAAKRASAPRKAAAPKKKKKSAEKKKSAKKTAASKRVDWDKILGSLPATFTIDDVMKDPGAKAKGRNQVYPAVNRWVKAKKARKVGTGRYKRVA